MKRTVLPVLVALAIVLSGCASATASELQPTPSTAPSAAAEAAATAAPAAAAPAPTASPTATAPAGSASVTCATVLTDDAVAELEADGFTLNPDVFALDDVMTSVMTTGFGCFWNRGGGDVRVWYAQTTEAASAWAEREEELIDDGWTRVDGILPGAIQAPTDNDKDYIPAMINRAGVTHYVSYAELLTAVVALRPAA
jgi:hypothetical protein